MKWKHGIVAGSATIIVAFLIVTVVTVVTPAADNTDLARSPSETGQPSATRSPEVSPSPDRSPSPRPRDEVRGSERPKPQKPGAGLDPAGVKALKAALEESRLAEDEPASSLPVEPNPALAPTLDFVLSSFNVLGSSHSAPGGTRSSMAPGTTRIRWAAGLLASRGVDVVGFQELQLDQARTFLGITNGRYDVYPGTRLGGKGAQNSIAWRTDTWEAVAARTIPIPYFNGNRMPMPVVLLRNRESGLSAYFANFHNPASTPRKGNQGRWRRMALLQEVALANRLMASTDYPVFLTGDLNERGEAFCTVTGRTAMIAANGGSNSGVCRPPRAVGIDWIFGSPDVAFSNYRADRSRAINRTSDHPLLVTDVRIGG
ncbi:MAG TPA: endonuclease/exonuclease/phosphatase family protein [Nocardioidaceae bacterium]|nr:endonuclease/exonuclease/phosphatase family protein [Nocardioidaceae bacterium]